MSGVGGSRSRSDAGTQPGFAECADVTAYRSARPAQNAGEREMLTG